MSFHISQELLLERAIVIWTTILLFGIVSIGGLWLWRRMTEKKPPTEPQRVVTPGTENSIERLEELARMIAELSAATGQRQQSSQPLRETLTEGTRR